jgi:hypothetical protein
MPGFTPRDYPYRFDKSTILMNREPRIETRSYLSIEIAAISRLVNPSATTLTQGEGIGQKR